MIYSEIRSGKEAQELLMEGVDRICDTTAITLGPMGRNVALAYSSMYGEIWQRFIQHDGVTTAKAISLLNEFEDMGAQIIKQASQKQVQDVGDGTTVVMILAQAIYHEIYTLTAAGANPRKLRVAIETGIEKLIREIQKLAVPVKTFEQLKQIATISAQDANLGEMIARTIDEMGVDGLVVAEESKSNETVVDKQKGMQLDKGWASEFFQTNPDKGEATLENPFILATDKSITTNEQLKELQPVIDHCAKRGKPLVIIAPHIGTEPMGWLAERKLRNIFHSLVITAPSFGQDQKNKLQDIAIYTGGKFIAEGITEFEDINPQEDLGECQYITASKSETIVVGGKGAKDAIDIRIKEIQTALKREEVDFDRKKMEERIAKFTTGVAVIKVGGATEVEMKERMEQVKDAIAATKAAKRYGIVPGGETIYLKIRNILNKENPGEGILYRALYKPFTVLLGNADMEHGEWYNKLQSAADGTGVNVVAEKLVDMFLEGIIDPASVSINALRNASSTAIELSTTGAVVIQKLDRTTERPKP